MVMKAECMFRIVEEDDKISGVSLDRAYIIAYFKIDI
jgi:hypothetical protein